MNSVQSRFPCGDIILEGELVLPDGQGPFPGVVVCHPHPLHGGNMWNNVVTAICQSLSSHSVAAFRFNFRGVGNSRGVFGKGIAEQQDVRAALAHMSSESRVDVNKIGLAGYSFGAGVALPVAFESKQVSLLALVSPALSSEGRALLETYRNPKFLIIGDNDNIIAPEQFEQNVSDFADSRQYRVVSGADHFWQGYEGELSREVTGFFVDGFGGNHPDKK